MEMIIKCGYLLLILFLIVWVVQAEETTGSLLPNGTGNSSAYQSVDNTIPSVSTNGFNTAGTIRDWGGELETTGTGSINYTGNLSDHATQQQLDNGIRSGFSYSGAGSLQELWAKAEFEQQTTAGQFESSTHVKARF